MKIFVSDLDGTLLDQNAKLTVRTEQILKELIRQGMHFTVASGRTPLSALPLLQGIGITLPLVLMNGAMIYDSNAHKCLYAVELGEKCVQALADAELRTGTYGMIISTDQKRLFLHMGSNLKANLWKKYYDMSSLEQFSVICPEVRKQTAADLFGHQVIYALYMDDHPEQITEMCRILSCQSRLTLDSYQDIYTENRWCLEITSSRASKRYAVEILRQLCQATYIVGFGDGKNDLPLFDACDACFAVANACSEIKAHANGVIGSNLEDGVALHLKTLWDQEQTHMD